MCYVSATLKMVQNAEATLDLFPLEELEELEIMKVMEARGLTETEVPAQCVITNMQFLDEMAKLEDNNTGRAAGASNKGSEAQTMVSKPISTGGSAINGWVCHDHEVNRRVSHDHAIGEATGVLEDQPEP